MLFYLKKKKTIEIIVSFGKHMSARNVNKRKGIFGCNRGREGSDNLNIIPCQLDKMVLTGSNKTNSIKRLFVN